MLCWLPHWQAGASPVCPRRAVVEPSGSALTSLSLQPLQTAEGRLAWRDGHSGLAASCGPPPSRPLRQGPGEPVSLAKCGDDGETLGSNIDTLALGRWKLISGRAQGDRLVYSVMSRAQVPPGPGRGL